MISKTAVGDLARALRRIKPDRLEWTTTDEGRYSLQLPTFRLLIAPQKGPDVQAEILLEIDSPSGGSVGTLQFTPTDSEYTDVHGLLESAQSAHPDWNRIVMETAREIQENPDTVLSREPLVATLSPPVPQRPEVELVRRFFEQIEGKWRCKYPSGYEDIEIDASGNYFTLKPGQGKVETRNPLPKFRLLLNSGDSELEHVEISKQLLNGRVFQVEVLDVTPRQMSGYAKHDEHSILYTRR